jgi:cell volume regulation protein A
MFDAMYIAILIGAALVVVAVFTSLLSYRFGAPLLLVFLLLGLVAGEDGIGRIEFDNGFAAFFIGVTARAIILFDSGFETRLATLRHAAAPAGLLATAGVLVTAAVVAVAARWLFGLGWIEALLMGAIVAPTDAAAVFFLLRVGDIQLRDRVRSTLEVESGSNDPMAIFLALAIVGYLAAGGDEGGLTGTLVNEFLLQAIVGGLVGVVGGIAIVQVLRRTSFEAALYPIIVLALALVTFATSAILHGSGFLAVFVAGIIAGNSGLRHTVSLRRFQAGTTWLAQIGMFVTLGLLATPSEFVSVLPASIGIALFLTVVARPLAVWVCLLPFGFSRQEMAFIAWVGLRGATSILLAILPIVFALPNGQTIFNATFIVVLVSLLLQGWTIGPVARFLGLIVPQRLGPVDRFELELPGSGRHEVVAYVVHPESVVGKGQRIPRWARPSLVVRDGRALRPHRFGRPQAGDRIYVITTPEYVKLLDKLFAGPAPGREDPSLYGEFAVPPDTRLGDIAKAYPIVVAAGDENVMIGAFLRRELAGVVEPGDRVALGPVDAIVRSVSEDGVVEEVGLAMEHVVEARPRIPIFQTPKEIAGMLRRWLNRGRPQARGPDSGNGAGES